MRCVDATLEVELNGIQNDFHVIWKSISCTVIDWINFTLFWMNEQLGVGNMCLSYPLSLCLCFWFCVCSCVCLVVSVPVLAVASVFVPIFCLLFHCMWYWYCVCLCLCLSHCLFVCVSVSVSVCCFIVRLAPCSTRCYYYFLSQIFLMYARSHEMWIGGETHC